MRKTIFIMLVMLLLSNLIICTNISEAGIVSDLSMMNGVSDISANSGSNITKTINNVIGLIQFAGTGIAVIVATMLGIKYMLAAPADKADTKKLIMPMLIGCVLLFGAVNIVGSIASLSEVLKS